MDKPKHHEPYWYVKYWDDGTWSCEHGTNELSWDDIYNIAYSNWFYSQEEAEAAAFDILVRLAGVDEVEASRIYLMGRRT